MKNRIAELRSEQGWSQSQLAGILSISRQTLSAMELAKTDPSLTLAMRLSWLFKRPIEEIFQADLDERIALLGENWEYLDRKATAFDEIGILEQMGRDGWEMMGFGALVLHFRRPENPELHQPWEYERINGLLASSKRSELERAGWLYCGSWMGVFHYFKREAHRVSE
jgi:DNA-binding XRE family transcriptional regulator